MTYDAVMTLIVITWLERTWLNATCSDGTLCILGNTQLLSLLRLRLSAPILEPACKWEKDATFLFRSIESGLIIHAVVSICSICSELEGPSDFKEGVVVDNENART